MSSQKPNTGAKFEGFEPEVDDVTIEKNWEKISYFLPAEKNKKKFMFLPPVIGKGLLLFVIGCAGVFTYVTIDERKETITGPVTSTPEIKKEPAAALVPLANEQKNPSNQTGPANEVPHNEPGNASVNGRSSMKLKKQSRWEPDNLNLGQITHQEKNSPVPINPGHPPVTAAGKEQSLETQQNTATPSAGTDDEIIITDLLASKSASLATAEQPELNPEFVFRNKLPATFRKKIILELFGGAGPTHTNIKTNDALISEYNSGMYGGIGLIYQVSEKWNFSVQCLADRSKMMSGTESKSNLIIDRSYMPNVSSLGPDTTYRYVHLRSENKLTSRTNFYINGGAGYKLYSKQKMSVEASLHLSARLTGYRFSSGNYQETDTMRYIRGAGAPPLSNQVIPEGLSFTKDYRLLSFGIIPGVTIGYALNNRLSIIAKPMYYKQLSTTVISPELKFFDLKQDNLMLNLGIRAGL